MISLNSIKVCGGKSIYNVGRQISLQTMVFSSSIGLFTKLTVVFKHFLFFQNYVQWLF